MPIYKLSNKPNFPPVNLANEDGLLAFDADEELSEEPKSEILLIVNSENKKDAYIAYHYFYF